MRPTRPPLLPKERTDIQKLKRRRVPLTFRSLSLGGCHTHCHAREGPPGCRRRPPRRPARRASRACPPPASPSLARTGPCARLPTFRRWRTRLVSRSDCPGAARSLQDVHARGLGRRRGRSRGRRRRRDARPPQRARGPPERDPRGALSSSARSPAPRDLNGWRLVVGGADDEARRDILVLPRRRPRRSPPRAPRQTHPRPRAHARVIVQDDGVGQRRARPEHGGGTSSSTAAHPRAASAPTPRIAVRPPEDFDGDVAKRRAARRALAGTAPLHSAPHLLHSVPSPFPWRTRPRPVGCLVVFTFESGEIRRAPPTPGGKVRFSRLMNRAARPVPLGVRVLAQGVDSPRRLAQGWRRVRGRRRRRVPWHIVKPDKGSQGAGIFLPLPLDLELRIRRTCKEALYSARMGGGCSGGGIGAGATSARAGEPADEALGGRGAVRWSDSTWVAGTIARASIWTTRRRRAGRRGPARRLLRAAAPGFVAAAWIVRGLGRLTFDLRRACRARPGTEGFPAFLSKDGPWRFCTAPYATPSW